MVMNMLLHKYEHLDDDGDDDDVGGDDNGDEENDDYDHLRGEGSHRASSQVLGNCCETWWQ